MLQLSHNSCELFALVSNRDHDKTDRNMLCLSQKDLWLSKHGLCCIINKFAACWLHQNDVPQF